MAPVLNRICPASSVCLSVTNLATWLVFVSEVNYFDFLKPTSLPRFSYNVKAALRICK
jgi:hypothetical protein